MQTVTEDIGRSVPCDSAQTLSQGYQGALNGDLDGKLYCVVYGDWSVAYGQLAWANSKLGPTGVWLASGWYADSFFRKAGDRGKIMLGVVGRQPSIQNLQPVRWFMPVDDRSDRDAVWANFLTKVSCDSVVRQRLQQITGGKDFGGLSSRVVVIYDGCHRGLEMELPVVGVVVNNTMISYQIDPQARIPGKAETPLAVLRGWGEVDHTNNCRVVCRNSGESFDAKLEPSE